MKAKKFRVTLTVLSLAVCTILKYRSKMHCRWADGEFCSPEEGWGPRAPSPVPRAASFVGSSSMAVFPGSAATPGEDAAGDRAGKCWSSSRTWSCKRNVHDPESPSAERLISPCWCLLWCSCRWQLAKRSLLEHRAVAGDAWILLTPHLRVQSILIAFWSGLRSLSKGRKKLRLFSTAQW